VIQISPQEDYKLDREAHVPLYYQLKKIIEGMIQDGVWQPGDKIPSENELKEQFEVSRTTVRLALNELVIEGKLKKQQGKGTFVAEPKVEHPLPSLRSFTKEVENKGFSPGGKVINLERKVPPKKVRNELKLDEQEECIVLERIRTVNGDKVGIHFAYLNPSLLKEPKFEQFNFGDNSLYQIIEEKYDIKIGEATETIEAAPADKYQSELLDIEEGFPMLVLKRLTYTQEQVPLEFVEIFYRSDRHKYSINLKN
jgi:GntR family transcriptional regulator